MNLLTSFADNEVAEMRFVVKKFRSVAFNYTFTISHLYFSLSLEVKIFVRLPPQFITCVGKVLQQCIEFRPNIYREVNLEIKGTTVRVPAQWFYRDLSHDA